jgi:hypothetical protein
LQKKDVKEYLKPHSVDLAIRDTDDITQVAVMIIRKLYGPDGLPEFNLSILQIISTLVEPLSDNV